MPQHPQEANPSSELLTTPASHVVVLIDASGSMKRLRDFVLDGANELLADLEPSVRVTLIQFNSRNYQAVVIDNRPAGDVAQLCGDDYQPGSSTPLYDAVGTAIGATARTVQEYEELTGRVASVVFAIISDGYENTSTRFTAPDIRRLIERYQEEGWDIQFLGLGIDAFTEGARIGVRRDRTMSSARSSDGVLSNFEAVSISARGPRMASEDQEES